MIRLNKLTALVRSMALGLAVIALGACRDDGVGPIEDAGSDDAGPVDEAGPVDDAGPVDEAGPFAGCPLVQGKTQLTFGSRNDEDPQFIRDADGTFVVAWTADDAEGDSTNMWFRRSADGLTWGEPWVNDTPGTAEQLSGGFVLDRAGRYHLVGAITPPAEWLPGIWHAVSDDLITWSEAEEIVGGKPYATGGGLAIDADGRFWLVHGDRTEGHDLWIMYSDDNGAEWSEPVGVTTGGPGDDEAFCFRITADGMFVVAFMRFLSEDANYLGPEGDSYYTTSADGLSWSDPLTIQDPDPDGAFVDTIPTVIETPRGTFIVWVSDRLGSGLEVLSVPLGGDAVTVVADAGFSTRTHDLGNGRVLFAFVQPHVVDGVSRNDVFFRVYDCSSPACGAK